MEYNAYGTNLSGWYNAPLFNSLDGRATPALKTICSFGENTAVGTIESVDDEHELWYDLQGRRINDISSPGIKVSKTRKIFVK